MYIKKYCSSPPKAKNQNRHCCAGLYVVMRIRLQVVDSGSTAVFNCTAQGTSTQPLFSWLKNGSPIRGFGRHEISAKGNRLTVRNVMKEDKGIYQCLSRDPDTDETAQASILLSLGGTYVYRQYV